MEEKEREISGAIQALRQLMVSFNIKNSIRSKRANHASCLLLCDTVERLFGSLFRSHVTAADVRDRAVAQKCHLLQIFTEMNAGYCGDYGDSVFL